MDRSERRSGAPKTRLLVALLAVPALAAGCSSKTFLMPTPNVYTAEGWEPFADVPEAHQTSDVPLLYVTDRAVERERDSGPEYGTERSRRAVFGEAVVSIGDDLTWEDLVKASTTSKRDSRLEIDLVSTREIARFGKTPPTLILTDRQMAGTDAPPVDPAQAQAEGRFREEMSRRLAASDRKDVFVYVHGFANTFEDAALTAAELWHFLGRSGVGVCYTWPAGVGGVRAYEYTIASTQFTIYHFKRTLRLIASCPEVERVNILAHSRGTAVVTDAIRELHLELRSQGSTQEQLKLGTVILAAADIDLDVAIARNATERVGRAAQRSALYLSDEDKALGFSGWLFGGRTRLGALDPTMFDRSEIDVLRHSRRLQLIDARVKKRGAFGHAYFHANPAVSSDIVLLMRYDLGPGEENGRPFRITDTGLWEIWDGYPGEDWTPDRIVDSP